MKRWAVAAVVAMGLVGSACGGSGSDLAAQAKFDDVGSLATGAPVMMNDVEVGKVTAIGLEGNQAVVDMRLDGSADVPQGVTAQIRSTSLLGERIVSLFIPETLPADAPPLRDGAVIRRTSVVPEFEDLVREGSSVLAPIAASEVETLVSEGAKGFGGRGQDLNQLLGDVTSIVHAYAGRTDQLRSLIASLNEFNSTLAEQAQAHGEAVVNTDRAIALLQEESGRLQEAIHSLNRLARGARGILEAHFDEMDRFFEQLRVIVGVLAQEQATITGFLKWAPNHNRNVQLVEYLENNQIFQDFVICGINDDPNDPARTCEPKT